MHVSEQRSVGSCQITISYWDPSPDKPHSPMSSLSFPELTGPYRTGLPWGCSPWHYLRWSKPAVGHKPGFRAVPLSPPASTSAAEWVQPQNRANRPYLAQRPQCSPPPPPHCSLWPWGFFYVKWDFQHCVIPTDESEGRPWGWEQQLEPSQASFLLGRNPHSRLVDPTAGVWVTVIPAFQECLAPQPLLPPPPSLSLHISLLLLSHMERVSHSEFGFMKLFLLSY